MRSTVWASGILAASLLVAPFVVAHTTSAYGSSKIVVYSALDEPKLDVLIEAFKDTGIEVEALVLEAAGTMAARVRSEAGRNRGDGTG